MRALCFTSISLALALAACNPYDPDLGEAPFACGEGDRCPEGYDCVDQVCVRGEGDDPEAPDARPGTFECNDDSQVEPNDATTNAHVTPIPGTADRYDLPALAVCPDSDRDTFRFGVQVQGKNLRAVVTTEVSDGPLLLQILNGQGNVIANGTQTAATEITVVVNNMSIGTYYVQVSAQAGVQNNYGLEIITCDVSGCP